MKNVLVFSLGGKHYALELRWVREVMTLGHISPVPNAPEQIVGVTNCRGANRAGAAPPRAHGPAPTANR